MSVQRYELEIYHCNGGEMIVSDTGDYVSHDDYAALDAKCAALAAENAALKQSELEYDATCREEFGSEWVTELTETPTTDAFLAEVRAQGVEMLHSVFNQAGCVGSPELHSAMNTFMLNISRKIRNGEFVVERKGAAQ